MNLKNKLIIAAGTVLLAIAVFVTVRNQQGSGLPLDILKKEKEYKLATPESKSIESIVSASGIVKAEKAASVKFQTSGLLAWVGVKEGDWVKKYQALASLDKRELKMRLEKEMNDYLSERWDFEQTQEDYETTKENHLVTDAIKRILEKAQFDLNNVVLDYEISNLTYQLATIYSPLNGLIIGVDTPLAGVNITPATATFTIVDPQTVYLETNVDEVDIGKIKEGQKAILIFDAYPEEKIESEIYQIAFQSQTTRGGGTVFPVRIRLSQQDVLKFKLGMNAEIEIVTAHKDSALVIPYSAITFTDDKTYVYLLRDGKKEKKEIETGIVTDLEIEVVSGLDQQDQVIVNGK